MNVIQTGNLSKSYGSHRVLHNISFEIKPGRLVGFLGPNGAGKTTTLRILLGLISAGSGTATIFGKSCRTQGKWLRKKIGYLPGDVHFYSNLTGRQTLNFLARARRLNCSGEIERLSERFELELDKSVRSYSTGMRQKLGLIQALMHRPELLILDEPTSALDPLVRQTVFEELRHVIADGRSVLFSSHSLDEVETLCDEVIILREGQIVEQQRIEVLRKRALRKVEIKFASAVPADLPKHFQIIERSDRTILGNWTTDIPPLIQWLDGFEIDDLIVERPDLNDLFITYYGNSSPIKKA